MGRRGGRETRGTMAVGQAWERTSEIKEEVDREERFKTYFGGRMYLLL